MLNPAANLAVIALASALLTPIVVGAVSTTSPVAQAAAAMPAAASVAATPAPAAEPACLRKVKVVYPGYGANTACAPTERVR